MKIKVKPDINTNPNKITNIGQCVEYQDCLLEFVSIGKFNRNCMGCYFKNNIDCNRPNEQRFRCTTSYTNGIFIKKK